MDWHPTLAMDNGSFIATTAILVGGCAFIVAMVVESWTKRAKVREREQSRREIAAYIAEGIMTIEQGEKLLQAGVSPRPKPDSEA